jgi:HK97 family phage prohead protease
MAIPEKYSHIKFVPPSGARREAEYGLKLRREHGRGGTAVGIARARDLSNGKEISPSTVRRMKAFFDRHASDAKAEGFTPGDVGFPSNGKIANLLWGGPSGYSWAKKVVEQMNAADERSYSLDKETRSIDVQETPAMNNVERRYLATGGAENSTEGMLNVEHRADPQTGEKRTYLVGYAAKFNTDSLLLGDFIERIAPTAFEIVEKKKDLDGNPLETRGLFNHDPNHLIGRYPNTMNLMVDKIGLRYEILLPESRKDLAESVARGDLKGSSFSFVVAEGGEKWTREGGKSRRLVTKIKALLDCGPVTYPAYKDASVAVAKRSYEQFLANEQPPAPKTDVAAEMRKYQEFIAERRGDCGRNPDGTFASGNACAGGGSAGGEIKKTTGGDSIKHSAGKVSQPDNIKLAQKAKDDYDKSIISPATAAKYGAVVGAHLGLAGGVAGVVAGTVTGALIGAAAASLVAVSASAMKSRLGALKKTIGVSDKHLSDATKECFGTNTKAKPFALDSNTIAFEQGDNIALISKGSPFTKSSTGISFHFQPGADMGGKFNSASVEYAAKAVGAKHVSIEVWHDEDVKKLEAEGYKQVAKSVGGYSSSKGVYEKTFGRSKRSATPAPDRYREFLDFYADRRGFCPTGDGGGIDNSCSKGEKGGGDEGKYPSSGKKPPLPSGQLAGYKVSPKMGYDKGTAGGKSEPSKYKEWKKGDHLDKAKEKDTQEFLDKAREEQMSKGGKGQGKADEGGGVQTWSKGEHFPWTVKQVGDTEGHVQGLHPDGSKTEKYPFKGGDTSGAMQQVSDEIKRRGGGKRSIDPRQVVADTLRFLKDRQ